ncbi:hypothetical protein ACJX0J_010303, partial [Zea mays]
STHSHILAKDKNITKIIREPLPVVVWRLWDLFLWHAVIQCETKFIASFPIAGLILK